MDCNQDGAKLAYVDTGPVDTANYPTLVCLHGQAFNSCRRNAYTDTLHM